MKSKITSKKPFDLDHVIIVDNVNIDPQTIENHRQRINTIFANESKEYRDNQINNMIMHDILFVKAMDFLYTHYEFEIDQDELKDHINFLLERAPESAKEKITPEVQKMIDDSARRLLVQKLIFDDIQKTYNIEVNDQELETILLGYYRQTNQPIRTFKQDPQRYEEARSSIINEKVITKIISLFKFNLDKFKENLEKAAKAETNK